MCGKQHYIQAHSDCSGCPTLKVVSLKTLSWPKQICADLRPADLSLDSISITCDWVESIACLLIYIFARLLQVTV